MFLIIMSYGEYDDHNKIPIMVAPTATDAHLIADDMYENPESEYLDYARKKYGDRLPPDAYFAVTELPVVCADQPSRISARYSKRAMLQEELYLWGKPRPVWCDAFTNAVSNELPWRFVIRLVNRLRRHREHGEQLRKLIQGAQCNEQQ